MKVKNGYCLMRRWFEFSFDNPEKVNPVHTALFMWCIELNNRLNWVEKFGLPTFDAMKTIGLKNRETYYNTFKNLVEWGFIEVVAKSNNQYTATVIRLCFCLSEKQTSRRLAADKQTSSRRLAPDTYINSKNNTNSKNFFISEKVKIEFEKFISEQKKPVSKIRIKALIDKLDTLAPNSDEEKIKIIQQAIRGGYSDFRPVVNKQDAPYINNSPQAPAKDVLIGFCVEQGINQTDAERIYNTMAYSWRWKDRKTGLPIIDNWKTYAKGIIDKCVKR